MKSKKQRQHRQQKTRKLKGGKKWGEEWEKKCDFCDWLNGKEPVDNDITIYHTTSNKKGQPQPQLNNSFNDDKAEDEIINSFRRKQCNIL
jgi:hypothetical protein